MGNEQHIPFQAIQWLCLFRNMLLVSASRHLGRKNGAKRSTYDGATGDYRTCYIVQGERAIYCDSNCSCGRFVPERVACF